MLQQRTLLVLCLGAALLLPSCDGFVGPSAGLAADLSRGGARMQLRSRARAALPICGGVSMQAQAEPPSGGSGDDDKFDMGALNARIQKVKERESNPVLNIQDKVTDAMEPVKLEAAKIKNKMPDPRAAIPVTGLPKWVVPISLILGLSIFSAVIQSTMGGGGGMSDGSGLASGSL